MISLVTDKLPELRELCRRYRVARLALFGSAARDDFDPEKSDLDFVIEFLPLELGEAFHTYFDFLFSLEDLFSRRVDLVMLSAVKNSYFLTEVLHTQQELYAA